MCLLILVEIGYRMTILQQVEVVVIFMPHFWSIAMHTVCCYCTNIKGLPICFREVQVKNDFTDNNNKLLRY